MNEVLDSIMKVGKAYVKDFVIDSDNESVIKNLIKYFFWDVSGNYNPEKGLLIRGKVGCGKTLLLRIFNRLCKIYNICDIRYFSCHEISNEFIEKGTLIIEKYADFYTTDSIYKSWDSEENDRKYKEFLVLFFDDLGLENTLSNHYGNQSSVMAEIILSRYNRYILRRDKTLFTTNLNGDGLEKLYGNRIRSRLREMCNDVVLSGGDRRK